MRILFSSTAGNGHLDPVLPVAEACREYGHEVFVAVPNREAPRAKVERYGLPCRPFDDSEESERSAVFASTSDPKQSNVAVVRDVFGRINTGAALSSFRVLLDELEPDLVVREPFEGASWLASAAAGVPTVLLPCTTSRSMDFVSEHLLAGVQTLVEGLAISPTRTQGARAVLTSTPAALDLPWNTDAVLRVAPAPPWPSRNVSGARPRVFVCFGTVAGFVPGVLPRIGAAVLEALASLSVDVLFAIGRGVDASILGDVPDNVDVTDFAPFRDVLPSTSVAVVHGGYGTTLGVMGAGIPSLVTPLFSYDQWDNAAAVATSGAGETLDIPQQTPDAIREHVTRLLDDDGASAAARAVGEEMAAQRPLSTIPRELERFAS